MLFFGCTKHKHPLTSLHRTDGCETFPPIKHYIRDTEKKTLISVIGVHTALCVCSQCSRGCTGIFLEPFGVGENLKVPEVIFRIFRSSTFISRFTVYAFISSFFAVYRSHADIDAAYKWKSVCVVFQHAMWISK